MKLSKLNFVFDSLKTKKSQPFILAHQYILTGAKYSSDGSYLTLEDGVTVIDPVAGGFSLKRNHNRVCNEIFFDSETTGRYDDAGCDTSSQLKLFACAK